MKILALDSSGLVASVAILEDDLLIGEYTIQYKKTHSQTLLPMLEHVAAMIDLDMSTIDAIAVAAGPGSFTGLRIGSATAKGFGFALGKPIIPVKTIEGLAYNLYGVSQLVCPILDARRNQVYTGVYSFTFCLDTKQFVMKEMIPQCAVLIDEIIQQLNLLEKEVIFLGDGVPVFSNHLEQNMKVPFTFAPAHMNRQRAASIGALAFVHEKNGIIQTAMEHEPDYLRASQAERERVEKERLKKE